MRVIVATRFVCYMSRTNVLSEVKVEDCKLVRPRRLMLSGAFEGNEDKVGA